MEKEILQFISNYVSLTDKEKQIFLSLNLIKKYEQGSYLLRQGQLSHECYFVIAGCLKSFYLNDGEEKITDFFVENDPITPTSYLTHTPSEYYISCLEDTILSVGNPEKTKELIERIPKFETVSNLVNLDRLTKKQIIIDDLLNLNPEQRYLKLRENRSDLIERVPQYMIASYLGIKPESLSRIRKRIIR